MVPVARTISIQERIAAFRPQMPATLAKIAALLIENPRAPVELSITELAERTGTSTASVTRFCRLIGFRGYVQLRVCVAEDLGRGGKHDETWATDIGRAFGPNDPPDDIRRTLLNDQILSLQTTAEMLDMKVMEKVAQKIAKSRHVDVYGVSGSALTAFEIKNRLYRIGINVHTWSEVHDGLTSAVTLDCDCVAIGVSNTGKTDETIQMLSRAKESGAFTVAITGSLETPIARVAESILVAASHDGYLQPANLMARHCQIFLVDLLYLLVAQVNFGRTTRLLSATRNAVSRRRRHNNRETISSPPSRYQADQHKKKDKKS